MVDVVQLGYEVETSQVARGEKALDGLGQSTKSAAASQKDLKRQADLSGGSVNLLGRRANTSSKAFGGLGTNARQLSLQLSQVAQQGAVTGDFFRAATVQAADIGIAFGTIGIVAGSLISVLGPLAQGLLTSAGGARDLSEALEAISDVGSDAERIIGTLTLSTAELGETYGEAAERVRAFALLEAQLATTEATSRLQEQVDLVRDQVDAYVSAETAGREYRNTLQRIQDTFGGTVAEARELEAQFSALASAETFGAQQSALEDVQRLFNEIGVEASDIPPEIASALREMIAYSNAVDESAKLTADLVQQTSGIADGIAAGADEAAALERNLRAAALEAISLRNLQDSLEFSGRGQDPRRFGDPTARNPNEGTGSLSSGAQALIDAANRRAERGSRGGRSTSEADRRQNELLSERDQLLDRLKSAQDRYNDGVAQADRLLKAQVITQETYNAEVARLDGELNSLRFEDVNRGIDGFAGSLSNAIQTANSLPDVFRAVLADIASQLISSNVRSLLAQTLAPGGVPNAFGSFIGGIFGGARATGGPVNAGTTYLVGERGPELFTASRSGTIIPNGQLGAGQGVQVEIVNPVVTATDDGAVMMQVEARIAENNAEQARALPGQVNAISSQRDPRLR